MSKQTKQPTCVIELRPPSKGYQGYNRERIKIFEKEVLTLPEMRKAFVGQQGRKYYFAFDTKTETYQFLTDTANLFDKRQVGWKREQYEMK